MFWRSLPLSFASLSCYHEPEPEPDFSFSRNRRRMARRARSARRSLRSPPRCSAYYSFLTQKKSNMVGVVKEETRPHVAHYSCCGWLRRSVPKAVVGAPSPTSLRCHPGRGVPLKGLSSTKESLSTRRARFSRRMQSTRGCSCATVACGSPSSEVSELRAQCKKGSVRSLLK